MFSRIRSWYRNGLKSLSDVIHHRQCIEVIPVSLHPAFLGELDRIMKQLNLQEITDPRFAQQIFLFRHREEWAEKVEEKLIPKFLKDIDFIRENECCRELSKKDFFHGHICGTCQTAIYDIDKLLSEQNIRLLYHTCERWFEMPYFAKRNIKSSLVSEPQIIPLEYSMCDGYYKTYSFPKVTVYSSELGWTEYGKIEFMQAPEGPYRLRDGTRLAMIGRLNDTHILRHLPKKGAKLHWKFID